MRFFTQGTSEPSTEMNLETVIQILSVSALLISYNIKGL